MIETTQDPAKPMRIVSFTTKADCEAFIKERGIGNNHWPQLVQKRWCAVCFDRGSFHAFKVEVTEVKL